MNSVVVTGQCVIYARCVSGTSESGVSPEAFVGKLASDILSQMPAVTDLRRLRRQYAASMTPTTVVLLQELERFNFLIVKMLQTLSNLGKVRVVLLIWPLAAVCVIDDGVGLWQRWSTGALSRAL